MKSKLTGAAGLAGAFVGGMVVGDGVGWVDGSRDQDAGVGGAGTAADRGEGHQPDDDGRGHRFAAARFAG